MYIELNSESTVFPCETGRTSWLYVKEDYPVIVETLRWSCPGVKAKPAMALGIRTFFVLFIISSILQIILSNPSLYIEQQPVLSISTDKTINCQQLASSESLSRNIPEEIRLSRFQDKSFVTGRGETERRSFLDVLDNVLTSVSSFASSMFGMETKSSRPRSKRISYKNHQLIRIFPTAERHVEDLRELHDAEPGEIKFWTQPVDNRTTDVVVSPDLLDDVKDYLRDRKIKFKVLISDLQKTISYQNPKMSKEQRDDLMSNQGHSMTWKRYHRYGDILKYLEYLSFRYPNLVELITIGHSFEGQPIKMIKVSTGPNKEGGPKPAIWIDAGMHAREWIGTAVATYILSQLVERNTTYAKLLESSDWLILPVANPDGYEYSHIGDRLWRKTRSSHGDSPNEARYTSGFFGLLAHYTKWLWAKCEGVDPNRNFAYHWSDGKDGGASSDPCHETYAGPSAFSEPETRAIADYILANKDSIKMYLTLHSYNQMWLVPWGYTRARVDDYSELASIAKKATNAIAKVHGTHYQVGHAADMLYPTSGASDDWAKGAAGIKYAYTIELRDRGTYGFLLPATQIVPTSREIWAGIRAIARLVSCNK